MKKLVVTLLKIGLSVAILVWLVHRAWQADAFGDLSQQFREPGFDWLAISGAVACFFVSVLLTLVRWYVLVRALAIPFTMREAMRLGFLGYLFNLAPMGIIGGDLLKAVLLARDRPGQRAKSVATVAVDRIIGLYVLFVVAAVAVVFTGLWRHPDITLRYIAWGTLGVTLASTAAMAMMFVPGVTNGRLTRWLGELPRIGPHVRHLIDAVRMYRHDRAAMTGTLALTVGVHVLFAIGIYLVTVGVYHGRLAGMTFVDEFVVAPLSAATGVIPLVAGPMEAVLDFLYVVVFGMSKGQGLVVALGYRLITLLIAAVGVCYYLGARGEVDAVMHNTADATPAGDSSSAALARHAAV